MLLSDAGVRTHRPKPLSDARGRKPRKFFGIIEGFYNTRRIHSDPAAPRRRRTSRDSTMRPEAKVQRRRNRSAPHVSWLFASSVMYVGPLSLE